MYVSGYAHPMTAPRRKHAFEVVDHGGSMIKVHVIEEGVAGDRAVKLRRSRHCHRPKVRQ